MNLEAKLQEYFGEYTKNDNGTYYVKLDNGVELFIPETISSNQSMIAYAPGSGGSYSAIAKFKDMYNGENPPECLTVVAPSSPDYSNILTIGTDTINNLGGQVDNIVYASFSAGGITGIQKTEQYLEQYPNASMSIISCDGCQMYNQLKDEYPNVKESQTPFVMLSGGLKYKYAHLDMVENGYNAYFLKVNNSQKYDHSQLNRDMIDYVLLYALGEQDEMPENNICYSLHKDNFDESLELENIRCTGAGNLAGYERNKYKSVLNLSTLTFTDLDNYSDTDQIGNGYVKADFEFLSTSLNEIRRTISKANIATKTPSLPIAGANGLVSAISACIDKYSSMTVSLYSKLAQETQATQSYGQSIINLDLQQKNKLETINDRVTLENTGTGTYNTDTTNVSTNTTTENTSTNTNTNTNSSNNSTTNNYSNIAKAATGVSTVASTSRSNSSSNTTSTNTTNPIINGNNMTWQYADGHNLTLTVENGKVTNMKFTYKYNTVNELNKNINNILVGEIDKQYFDKMTIIDKTVEVTIKEDYFNNLSLSKIKELFFK